MKQDIEASVIGGLLIGGLTPTASDVLATLEPEAFSIPLYRKAFEVSVLRNPASMDDEGWARVANGMSQLADLDVWVNAFIRERDRDLPCISCGTLTSAQWDAGHYRTTAAAPQVVWQRIGIKY